MNVEYLKTKDRVLFDDLLWCTEKIVKMPQLKDTTILITGATGLVGSLIVKAILLTNYLYKTHINVIALVRDIQKSRMVFDGYYEEDTLRICCADLCNDFMIEGYIDYMIHTASVTASKLFVNQPVETIDLTYRGTSNVLKLCRCKNIKAIVYLSSMEVYGKVSLEKEFIHEDDLGYIDILNVRSSYSEGKRIAECMCASYHREYGVNVKIARLAQTFGAGISLKENRVFAQFANSVINGEDIVLHTTGESYGNYCYIREAIWGILLVLLEGSAGEAYSVVNDKLCVQIRDMANMVADNFGNGNVKVVYDIPNDAMSYGYAPEVKMHLSGDKLKKLGWRAEVDLIEAYSRMIASLKEQKKRV